jgi:hypothetical protein
LYKDFLKGGVLIKALYLALASKGIRGRKHKSSILLKKGILIAAYKVNAIAVAI